jgi:hypothetical protein
MKNHKHNALLKGLHFVAQRAYDYTKTSAMLSVKGGRSLIAVFLNMLPLMGIKVSSSYVVVVVTYLSNL